MKKLLVLFACCLLAATALATEAPKEGVDYDAISPAPPPGTGNEVEVMEFFMYTCPHCKTLDPALQEWVKKQPENIKFQHMPAMFGGSANLHAKTYFALEVMGEAQRVHQAFFKAIHDQKRRLRTQKDIEKFLGEHDVDLDKFRETMKSFTVQTKANRAAALMRRYGIRSVPAMVVDGRYRIKNTAKVLDTTDALIEKTIADRQ
ncbi:thiol:disulfide interchange protein DsbA/DsbL [Thiolapillus sp.]